MALPQVGLLAIIEGLGNFSRGANTIQKAYGDIERKTGDVTRASGGLSSALTGVGKGLLHVGTVVATAAAAGIAAVATAAIGLGTISVTTASSFESAFAGVLKTTDGLTDSTGALNAAGKELKQGFEDLTTTIPASFEELAGIGELGGQLGIPKAALLDFTETIAALGVSTNLTQDEAATALARMANIYAVSADDMGGNVEQMGSTIVALGNNFATTEADVTNFALRLAGAGKIAGLTQADVFGIAAAMSSVGVEAEAGGTAVQKALLAMNESVVTGDEKLKTFAETAGLSVDEFSTLWKRDASQAFSLFVQGLGKQGDAAVGTLSELGLEDQRLISAFLRLAGAGDLIDRSLGVANQAFEENTALSEEAEKRYATFESQVKMFKNELRLMAAAIGQYILPKLVEWMKAVKPVIEAVGKALPGAIEGLFQMFKGGRGGISGVAGIFEALGFSPRKAVEISTFISNIISSIRGMIDTVMGLIGTFKTGGVGGVAEALGIPDWVFSAWETLQRVIGNLLTFWQEQGPGIMASVSETFNRVAAVIGDLASKVIPWVVAQFEKISEWFVENGPLIQEAIALAGQRIAEFAEFAAGMWGVVEPILSGVIDVILDIVKFILQLATGDWPGAWESIKKIVFDAWEAIKGAFLGLARWVTGWFGSSWEDVTSQWSENWETFKLIVSTAWEAIKTRFTEAVASVGQTLTNFADSAGSTWQNIKTTFVDTWNTLWDAVKTKVDTVSSKIKTVLDDIAGGFNAIKDAIKKLIEKVEDFIDKIKDIKLPKWLPGGSPPLMATWFDEIGAAVKKLSSVELPQLATSLEIQATPAVMQMLLQPRTMAAPVTPMMAATAARAGNTSNITYNYTQNVTTAAPASTVIQDFNVLRALVGD